MPENFDNVDFIIGNSAIAEQIREQRPLKPFADEVIAFLNTVSKVILNDKASSRYSDVVTFAFWCRKASVEAMKKEYLDTHYGNLNTRNGICYGRGCVFHIAPSNVAVNYAYSLTVGLLAGNANVVRLPSKDFPQMQYINKGIQKAIEVYPQFSAYICLIKYSHDKDINDYFSLQCDTRIIWGGDDTIAEIRKSPLKPRANEITFADRYSIAVIDSENYCLTQDKARIASDFYNDTYLMDQNACTSPRIVIWFGKEEISRKAQELFWRELMPLVDKKYTLQPVQAVNKLVSVYKLGAACDGVKVYHTDNKLIRVQVENLSKDLMGYRDNSGFFMEYYAETLREIEPLCISQCQTLSYNGISENEIMEFLMEYRPSGVDRAVPIGKTMDFGLIWDGYDLIGQLTRNVIYC